jgi:hypothetical protein
MRVVLSIAILMEPYLMNCNGRRKKVLDANFLPYML